MDHARNLKVNKEAKKLCKVLDSKSYNDDLSSSKFPQINLKKLDIEEDELTVNLEPLSSEVGKTTANVTNRGSIEETDVKEELAPHSDVQVSTTAMLKIQTPTPAMVRIPTPTSGTLRIQTPTPATLRILIPAAALNLETRTETEKRDKDTSIDIKEELIDQYVSEQPLPQECETEAKEARREEKDEGNDMKEELGDNVDQEGSEVAKQSMDDNIYVEEGLVHGCNNEVERASSTHSNPTKYVFGHFPMEIPPSDKKRNPTRKCVVCSRKRDSGGRQIRRESRYMCEICKVTLCITPCFKLYHIQ